jgi:hypothetical protein
MDIGSIFLILALLLLVGLFVSRPFFERSKDLPGLVSNIETDGRSVLLAERDRVLTALQELDFDHALGKIPKEDYPIQREILRQRGVEILRELDAIQEAGEEAGSPEDRIEQEIAARRAGSVRGVSASVASPDDELEVMLANRRRERQEKAVGFCPQCGGPLQKSDRFCPKCGAEMA